MLVSVLVAVYNVEQYIERCARSLFEQTYDNIEYVFVDDCTPDRSIEILKMVMEDYPNRKGSVKIIHHEKNLGLGAARNTGLKNSEGDYVCFVDSDDYLHIKAIELLVATSKEEHADLVVGDFLETNASCEDFRCPLEHREIQRFPVATVMFEMLASVALRWCTVWNKLYKRNLIEGVLFNEEAYSIEDQDFNIRVYQKIDSVVYVPQCLYFYYQNPNSIVRNPSTTAKRFYLNTKYRFKMLEHIQPGENDEKYSAWIMDYGFRQVLDRRGIVKGTEYDESYRQMVKDVWRKTRKDYLTNDEISSKEKCHFMLYCFFPQLSNCYLRVRKKDC